MLRQECGCFANETEKHFNPLVLKSLAIEVSLQTLYLALKSSKLVDGDQDFGILRPVKKKRVRVFTQKYETWINDAMAR